jgi:hypothetical protein
MLFYCLVLWPGESQLKEEIDPLAVRRAAARKSDFEKYVPASHREEK